MKANLRFRHRLLSPRGLAAVALSAAVAACGLVGVPESTASDHIDGPQLAHDHAADLNDTYAFLDPTDNTRLVMIMTTNPFIISSEAIGQSILDHNLRYRFEIENTGDATPDLFIDTTFTRGVGRLTAQTATVRFGGTRARRADPTFTAQTTVALQDETPATPVVTDDAASGIRFFAGIADDPFFLDNTAANRWVVSSIQNPGRPDDGVFARRIGADGRGRDTYAGFNTLAIAVSIPLDMVRGSAGNMIGINSATQRQSTQRVLRNGQVASSRTSRWLNLDRCANPLVVNGLIPPDRKDEYNGASTAEDATGRFESSLREGLRNLGTNEDFTTQILTVVQRNGDIVRVNTAIPNTGPGGGNNPEARYPVSRRLGDDVGDIIFTLINNGEPITDGVLHPRPFENAFPFLGLQILPNPQGVDDVDDETRL